MISQYLMFVVVIGCCMLFLVNGGEQETVFWLILFSDVCHQYTNTDTTHICGVYKNECSYKLL